MKSLETRIPPLLLVFIFAAGMYGVASFNLASFGHGGYTFAVELAAVIAGMIFCLLGLIEFRRAGTTVNPVNPGSTTALVKQGIYRISRNPMYVGFLLLLIAWGIHLSDLLALMFGLLFVPYLSRFQIAAEERALIAIFGDEYTQYQAAVRRWL